MFGQRKTLVGVLALMLGALFCATSVSAGVVYKTSVAGTGNASPNYRYYRGPVSGYYRSNSGYYNRYNMYSFIRTKAEMDAAGIPKGAVIVDMEINQTTNHTFQPGGTIKLHMWMGNDNLSALPANTNSVVHRTGKTKVIDDKDFALTGQGWTSFGAMDPFTYTGETLNTHMILDVRGYSGTTAATKPFGSTHTSTTNGPQFAASATNGTNQAVGYAWNTNANYSYNINAYPYSSFGLNGTSTSSTYYSSSVQKTDVRYTYFVPLGISSETPDPAVGGLPFDFTPEAAGGDEVYRWSIIRNSNADWLNVDPGTGRLTGTPASAQGGTVANFTLVLKDENGFGDTVMETYNLPINSTPKLPYANNFEGANPLGDFAITSFGAGGISPRQTISNVASATVNGVGLLLDTNNASANWVLAPETNAANQAIINDPDMWFPGQSTPDGSAHHSYLELALEAPGAKELEIAFDLKMTQGSTSLSAELRNNMVVEVSDDLGGSWMRVSGAQAQASGIYQGKTIGFNRETISVTGLSGSQDFLLIRWRTLIRLNNGGGFPTSIALDNLAINAPLDFRDSSFPAAQETAKYNHQLHGSGGEAPYTTFAIVGGSLPQGMDLIKDGFNWYLRADAFTIPTTAAGTYPISLQVTDSTNATATRSFDIIVEDQPPALGFANLANLPSAGEGNPYSFVLTAKGGVPFPGNRYKWSVVTTNAPWLDFVDDFSGRLAGTPPANSAGQQVQMTIRIEDDNGSTFDSPTPFSLDVVGELTVTTAGDLRDAPEGDTYRESLFVVGGQPPYSWSFVSGTIPDGLTLLPLQGKIVGAANRDQMGSYDFKLLVVDSGTQSKEVDFTLQIVNSSAPFFSIITANSLPSVSEGNQYSSALDASGGVPPYTWSVLPGTAPPGLSISSTGEIIGTPTAGSAKTYTVDVRITDADGASTTQSFSIEVLPDIQPVSITTASTLQGRRVGDFFVSSISATGGVAPYTWELLVDVGQGQQSRLPEGVEFSQAGSSAIISGLPRSGQAGNYSFRLRVTDATNQFTDRTFTLAVAPIPAGNELGIVWHSENGILPRGREGDSYGLTLQGLGGVAPYTFGLSPTSSDLPAGLSINPFGAISGTPVGNSRGTYSFTVRINDSIGDHFDRNFTVEVLEVGTEDDSPIDVTPAQGAISRNGGCAVATSSQVELALALLLLAMAALFVRRRQEA